MSKEVYTVIPMVHIASKKVETFTATISNKKIKVLNLLGTYLAEGDLTLKEINRIQYIIRMRAKNG